jgi:hypothetical protein
MKRSARTFLAALIVVLIALTLSAVALAPARDASTSLSFFSGGHGARANWVANNQAIRLSTTKLAASHVQGFAGVFVQHVAGIPATQFPDASFRSKAADKPGLTLGSPRLMVEFVTRRGTFVGYAALSETERGSGWEAVNDRTNFPKASWEVNGGPCGSLARLKWATVQTCFVRDKVASVFIVADAFGIDQLIDDITVNGATFSDDQDNAGGNNSRAGPTATTDPSLLPKMVFPPS